MNKGALQVTRNRTVRSRRLAGFVLAAITLGTSVLLSNSQPASAEYIEPDIIPATGNQAQMTLPPDTSWRATWPKCNQPVPGSDEPGTEVYVVCDLGDGNLRVREPMSACTNPFTRAGLEQYCHSSQGLRKLPLVPKKCDAEQTIWPICIDSFEVVHYKCFDRNKEFFTAWRQQQLIEEGRQLQSDGEGIRLFFKAASYAFLSTGWFNNKCDDGPLMTLEEYHRNILGFSYCPLDGPGFCPIAPKQGELLDTENISQMGDGLAWYALLLCLIGLLLSCAMWAIGCKSEHPGTELAGKSGIILCIAAAFVIGAAPGLINYFNHNVGDFDGTDGALTAEPVQQVNDVSARFECISFQGGDYFVAPDKQLAGDALCRKPS